MTVFCTMQNKNLIQTEGFFQNPLFFRTYICYDKSGYVCTKNLSGGISVKKTRISTRRQSEILQYIKDFLVEKGYPPSVREIGTAVGLKSSSTVHRYLAMLEENGAIRRDATKPRAIDIMGENPWGRTIPVPLVGVVTAGEPILAEQNVEDVFSFPRGLIGTAEDVFMLRIQGDSMINVGIFDGDFVLVRQQPTANNGEIVVALVDGESATVKRFFREKNCIRLQPENDSMEPFYETDVQILGKVIGLYRHI